MCEITLEISPGSLGTYKSALILVLAKHPIRVRQDFIYRQSDWTRMLRLSCRHGTSVSILAGNRTARRRSWSKGCGPQKNAAVFRLERHLFAFISHLLGFVWKRSSICARQKGRGGKKRLILKSSFPQKSGTLIISSKFCCQILIYFNRECFTHTKLWNYDKACK